MKFFWFLPCAEFFFQDFAHFFSIHHNHHHHHHIGNIRKYRKIAFFGALGPQKFILGAPAPPKNNFSKKSLNFRPDNDRKSCLFAHFRNFSGSIFVNFNPWPLKSCKFDRKFGYYVKNPPWNRLKSSKIHHSGPNMSKFIF